MTLDEIKVFAENIMQSRRVKNKAVVLCEGGVEAVRNKGLNPSFYRSLEKKPDADFYKACLPKKIRVTRCPQFFNCGDQSNVLKVFETLRELHTDKDVSKESYLDCNRLFALVDLDIQKANINNYTVQNKNFKDTEEIFYDLYEELEVNRETIANHAIFTTGLIHKEAYFLLPELKDLFSSYKNKIFHKDEGTPFELQKIYHNILDDLEYDTDLSDNFLVCSQRLSFFYQDISDVNDLKLAFVNEIDSEINPETIKRLFLVRKAKPYWEQLKTNENLPTKRFQEQLALKIAQYYSDKNDARFHLTAIFNAIYEQSLK